MFEVGIDSVQQSNLNKKKQNKRERVSLPFMCWYATKDRSSGPSCHPRFLKQCCDHTAQRTCCLTESVMLERVMHSMNRQTAALMISPPRPRYKRSFSIVGTSSASFESMAASQLDRRANTASPSPSSAPCRTISSELVHLPSRNGMIVVSV